MIEYVSTEHNGERHGIMIASVSTSATQCIPEIILDMFFDSYVCSDMSKVRITICYAISPREESPAWYLLICSEW